MAAGQETVLDEYAFLVSETDSKGIITFANEQFCNMAEYSLEELLGKPHNIVRHSDMPKVDFDDLWKTVHAGNVWQGYVKNKTKNIYTVNKVYYKIKVFLDTELKKES